MSHADCTTCRWKHMACGCSGDEPVACQGCKRLVFGDEPDSPNFANFVYSHWMKPVNCADCAIRDDAIRCRQCLKRVGKPLFKNCEKESIDLNQIIPTSVTRSVIENATVAIKSAVNSIYGIEGTVNTSNTLEKFAENDYTTLWVPSRSIGKEYIMRNLREALNSAEEFKHFVRYCNTGIPYSDIPKKIVVSHSKRTNTDSTVVIWNDGSKTIVKRSQDDPMDVKNALVWAFAKKIGFNTVVRDALKKVEYKGFEDPTNESSGNDSKLIDSDPTCLSCVYHGWPKCTGPCKKCCCDASHPNYVEFVEMEEDKK